MPSRQDIPRLFLEDASIDVYDETLPKYGSDDELGQKPRAAKRRRIEALGESYLRGKPLFISSASLRGPFDDGWVNPWRKHRKGYEAEAANTKTIIKTESKNDLVLDAIPETDNNRNKKVGGKGIRSGDRDSRQHSTSSKSKSHSKRQPKSSCMGQSAEKRPNVQRPQDWLKREKKAIDIQNYDPPKSPSNRYASSGVSGAAKRPKSARIQAEPGLVRAIKSHQTDLRKVRRNKNVSGDSQGKRDTTGSSPISSKSGEHNQPRSSKEGPEVLPTPKIEIDQRLSANISKNANDMSSMAEFKPEETTVPSSTSSVHVIPPSSHLPEFQYRLAKIQAVKGPEERPVDPCSRAEEASFGEGSKNGTPERGLSQPRPALPDGHQDQVSRQVKTSTATLGSMQNQNESSTESEKIPSAQIVPKPPGNSDCFISLHSTEICALGAADSRSASVDEEISTQAAFELAQKSFQDDLVTPQKDNPSPSKAKRHSSIKRITPFANVNSSQSLFDIKINSKNTPGAAHNMDTQAMIDAFTPFSGASLQKSGKRSGQKSSLKTYDMNSYIKKTISFATSPPPLSRSTSLDRSSFKEGQDSGRESLLPLPLTLSGTTPPTNQQDGQGVIFSMDAFDVSQVIQDAGSWLQQSWDIGNDLRRCSASTGRGTQSSPPSSRHEFTLI